MRPISASRSPTRTASRSAPSSAPSTTRSTRSEEHTSELQSPDQHSFPTRRSSDLAGDGKKPKDTAISRFVDDLHDLRGASVAAEPAADLAPFGLNAPDLRITLTDKDGQPIGTILGTKHDAKY